jgi:beta-N-acetylhexosaminidase
VNSTEIPLAFFALGSPYQIRQFPNIRNYALGYGLERSTLMASARALFGEIPFTGKLPIRIPDLFSVGAGLTTSLDGPLK